MKSSGAPHPLVTITGVLVMVALLFVATKTHLLPPGITIALAIAFAVLFRDVSKRSARKQRERKEAEMQKLRETPVLHLND